MPLDQPPGSSQMWTALAMPPVSINAVVTVIVVLHFIVAILRVIPSPTIPRLWFCGLASGIPFEHTLGFSPARAIGCLPKSSRRKRAACLRKTQRTEVLSVLVYCEAARKSSQCPQKMRLRLLLLALTRLVLHDRPRRDLFG